MKKNNDLNVEKIFKLAIQNHRENNLQDAINLYNQVLEQNLKHADSLNNLGILYLAQEKYQKAKSYSKKAVVTDPEYVAAHVNLSNIHLQFT